MRGALMRALENERSEYTLIYRTVRGILADKGYLDDAAHSAALAISNALWNLDSVQKEDRSLVAAAEEIASLAI